MKRGIFISLLSLILVGTLITSLYTYQNAQTDQSAIERDALTLRQAMDAANRFDTITLPTQTRIVLKDGLVSGKRTTDDLEALLQTSLTPATLTLDTTLPNDVTIGTILLESVRHVDPYTLRYAVRVDYILEIGAGTWSREKRYDVDVRITGVPHPFPEYGGESVVPDFWQIDFNEPCFLSYLNLIPGASCTGIDGTDTDGVCPRTGCYEPPAPAP